MEQRKYFLKSDAFIAHAQDGSTIQEGERALYQHKGIKSRRYRSNYPVPKDRNMRLLIVASMSRAKQEQKRLFEYCGDVFDIYDYETKQKVE